MNSSSLLFCAPVATVFITASLSACTAAGNTGGTGGTGGAGGAGSAGGAAPTHSVTASTTAHATTTSAGGSTATSTVSIVLGTDSSCTSAKDCVATGYCDVGTGLCVPPPCTNGVRDTGETDVDCGGSQCVKCGNGKRCAGGSDCTSAFCDSKTTTCTVSPCKNGVKDGNETDLDCGGATCTGCADSLVCAVDTDCTNGFCDATKHCAADPCKNGIKDSNEGALDCGGTAVSGTSHVCAKCMSGVTCAADGDCASATCLHSKVCDGPCTGLCTVAPSDAHLLTGFWESSNVEEAQRCYELFFSLANRNAQMSNLGTRILTVNGTASTDLNAAIQASPQKGGFCVQFSAGAPAWTSFSVWGN